mmetsp:Transcript_5211/g.13129  ORF Transcript_5211/g.13129 Transcript_5211/m.13129 type:complete len:401 (+) Transcript_5211:34-1236(+)
MATGLAACIILLPLAAGFSVPSLPVFRSAAHGGRGGAALRLVCQDQTKVSKGFNVLELTGALIPQGKLVTGVKTGWKFAWTTLMRELAPQSEDGSYVRPKYTFQQTISSDPGAKFPDEAGRYHLYAGKACPWCHRVELARAIRGLESYLSITTVLDRPEEASRGGWVFERSDPDPLFGARDLREVYDGAVRGGFRGRCTAPLMVCKKTKSLVCNESADLVRMLNRVQAPPGSIDLYPEALRKEIDSTNEWVYEDINNGVYRCGFATTQVAYDKAEESVFKAMDRLEEMLSKARFLCGDKFTEADLRLFPTIYRFDSVYHILFRCSRRRVSDYPSIQGWLSDVYSLEGVKSTCDLKATVDSYYTQLFPLNPGGIVVRGPSPSELGLDVPSDRSVGDPFWYH